MFRWFDLDRSKLEQVILGGPGEYLSSIGVETRHQPGCLRTDQEAQSNGNSMDDPTGQTIRFCLS